MRPGDSWAFPTGCNAGWPERELTRSDADHSNLHCVQRCTACNNIRVSAPSIIASQHSTTLREAKKRITRQALIRAARDLIAERGLDAVTVEQICASAEVSRRTFFNYFDAKEDAALGVEDTRLDPEFSQRFIVGGPTGDLAQDIIELVKNALAYSTERCEDFKEILTLAGQEPRLLVRQVAWMEREQALIMRLMKERLGPEAPATQVEITTLAVFSLLRASIMTWQRSDNQGRPSDHVVAAAQALTAALTQHAPSTTPV